MKGNKFYYLLLKVTNEQNQTSYHSVLKSVKPYSLLKEYKYVKKVKKVAILTIKSKNQKSIKSSTKIKETQMDIAIQGRSTMRLSHSIR